MLFAEAVAVEELDAPEFASLPLTAVEVAEPLSDAEALAVLAEGPVACADAVPPLVTVEEQLSPVTSVLI